jgi:dolichol-phosphate mannosyltransferase
MNSTFPADTGSPRYPRVAKPAKAIVVLPAYNEEQHIAPLLEKIDDALQRQNIIYQIIVVDDGSVDGTLAAVESCREQVPVTLCRHEVNQGLGRTIRDGLRVASEMASPDDIVVTMDADETHVPDLIPRMLQMIHEGRDVVIASRYQPGASVIGLSWFRRALSYGASLLFRTVFPTRNVRDFTCGYRAYRASVLRGAVASHGDNFVATGGFECMVDLLLTLRSMHVVFGEVPIVLRYDFKHGASKMQVAKTIRRSLAVLIRHRFQGVTPRPPDAAEAAVPPAQAKRHSSGS